MTVRWVRFKTSNKQSKRWDSIFFTISNFLVFKEKKSTISSVKRITKRIRDYFVKLLQKFFKAEEQLSMEKKCHNVYVNNGQIPTPVMWLSTFRIYSAVLWIASVLYVVVILYQFLRSRCMYYGNTGCRVFKRGGTKLERFLPKNQHTQRKLLNFENWISGGLRSFQKSEF